MEAIQRPDEEKMDFEGPAAEEVWLFQYKYAYKYKYKKNANVKFEKAPYLCCPFSARTRLDYPEIIQEDARGGDQEHICGKDWKMFEINE